MTEKERAADRKRDSDSERQLDRDKDSVIKSNKIMAEKSRECVRKRKPDRGETQSYPQQDPIVLKCPTQLFTQHGRPLQPTPFFHGLAPSPDIKFEVPGELQSRKRDLKWRPVRAPRCAAG